jgi:hypothetical protein
MMGRVSHFAWEGCLCRMFPPWFAFSSTFGAKGTERGVSTSKLG